MLFRSLVAECRLSIGRATRAVGLSRSAWYKPPLDRLEKDQEVIAALTQLTEANHRWGFWQCYQQLRFAGYGWNLSPAGQNQPLGVTLKAAT